MSHRIRIRTTIQWVIGCCVILASASSGHEVRPSISQDVAVAELQRSSPQQVCLTLSELKHILLAPDHMATGLVIGDIQVDTSFSVDAIESVENLPTAPIEFVGSSKLAKYSLAAVSFFPMYYDRPTQKLVFISSVVFELITLQEQSAKGQWIESRIYDAFVADYCLGYHENADSYDDLPQPQNRSRFAPKLAASFTDEDVPYVIITSSSLKPHYDEYCAYKTLQGLNTKVVDLDWIRENFYYGSEIQDNIREFVRYAHLNWGTMWVLIGGDYEVVPSKDLWSMKEGGDYIISDYYYACLDGYWNFVADEYIGEVKDSVDFYPELFIGRIPVESASEISNYLNKLRQYESDSQFTGYQQRTHYTGSLIGYPGDSKWIVDTLASLVPSTFGTTIQLEYIDTVLTAWTKEDFLYYFNQGNSFYFAYGHSRSPDHIFLRKEDSLHADLTAEDAANMSNNGKYPIISMIGCSVNAINSECLSKSFLNNPAGGAIGFAASPARDAGYASYRYVIDMFSRAYQSTSDQTIGEIATLAHLANSGFGSHFDGFTR